MRAFQYEKKTLCLLFGALIFASGVPNRLFADDKESGSLPPKPAAGKRDAPAAGLTERELWLLDRVEQLEKRVASPAVMAASAPVPQPTAENAVNVPVASGAPVAAPASAAPASTNAIPTSSVVASLGTQATEKGKSGAAKAPATEPFAFADFTWLNGNARTKEVPMDTKFFTPEIRADISYIYDFDHPKDDTIGGSSEVFRSKEVHVTQLGVGGDFHYDNVRARLMTQFGLYSQTTPRNDASPSRGQWNLDNAYRYVSEAYGGYHFNVLHGINVDAGIFMSYIGLFSYYNFDNWAYQPSFVSSNTPWFSMASVSRFSRRNT